MLLRACSLATLCAIGAVGGQELHELLELWLPVAVQSTLAPGACCVLATRPAAADPNPCSSPTSPCLPVQDMTTLAYLNEPSVLWNLKARYQTDDIYTYTGSILIAVNPFAPMPHLYGLHMMEQYRGLILGELSPHVYAIADESYRQMRKESKSQSILVRCCDGGGPVCPGVVALG